MKYVGSLPTGFSPTQTPIRLLCCHKFKSNYMDANLSHRFDPVSFKCLTYDIPWLSKYTGRYGVFCLFKV